MGEVAGTCALSAGVLAKLLRQELSRWAVPRCSTRPQEAQQSSSIVTSSAMAAHFAHQSLVSPPSNQWLCHREHLSAHTFIGTETHDISSQCPAFVDISGRAVC